MEFKGTRGKWFACCIETSPHYIFAHGGNITICQPYISQDMGEDLSLEEYRANALLISKAPEMLEYLMDALNENKSGEKISDGWFKNVEQLIKEAIEL